jgi:hypothetical protein
MIKLTLLTVLFALFVLTMAGKEDFIKIIKKQQKQIDFLINEIQEIKQKPVLEQKHFEKISEIILKKTTESFRVPNLSYKNPDIDLDSGIKFIIIKKQEMSISDINFLRKSFSNITIINPTVYYEIKFYVKSTIKEIPFIPIFDEDNIEKSVEKNNIFNIIDKTHRFVPKIFCEIKTENGELDIIQIN